jgi:phosphoribosylanthranilate isomerase
MNYYYPNQNEALEAGPQRLRLKVCGMNKNTSAVAALTPDYLGFIFWEPSKRYFNTAMPDLPHTIKKVGVFVDASLGEVKEKVAEFQLLLVQLHGQESAAYCQELKALLPQIKIIKVFSIRDTFNFKVLEAYESVCDHYLFDTKGALPGGNGYRFNWDTLKDYPSTKTYFLSGGIGLADTAALFEFLKRPEAKYCHAVDVNSTFEVEPGLKDIEQLKAFKTMWIEQ